MGNNETEQGKNVNERRDELVQPNDRPVPAYQREGGRGPATPTDPKADKESRDYLRRAGLYCLIALIALVAPACASTATQVSNAVGQPFHAAAADVAPDATYRAAGLAVLMDTTVSDATPAVSRYAFIGLQNTLGMQLVTTGNLQGAWKIEVSCSPTAVAALNTAPYSSSNPVLAAVNDDPSDITSAFTPSIAAVTTASSQYVQASPLNAGYVRATFTASTGSGRARVNFRN